MGCNYFKVTYTNTSCA